MAAHVLGPRECFFGPLLRVVFGGCTVIGVSDQRQAGMDGRATTLRVMRRWYRLITGSHVATFVMGLRWL